MLTVKDIYYYVKNSLSIPTFTTCDPNKCPVGRLLNAPAYLRGDFNSEQENFIRWFDFLDLETSDEAGKERDITRERLLEAMEEKYDLSVLSQ